LTKTLTIKDEVYKKLVSVKEKDESFSDLFERLVSHQGPKELLGSLRGRIELSPKDKRELLLNINKRREERRN
jgi:predicted CopG family antitoxin